MQDIHELGKHVARNEIYKTQLRGGENIEFSELWVDGSAKVKKLDYELPEGMVMGTAGLKVLNDDAGKPEIIAMDYVSNMSSMEQSLTSTLSGSVTSSESWTFSESVETGVEAEISIGCLIADSNIKLHMNHSITSEKSHSVETSTGWEKSLTISVAPKSAGKCSLIAYKADLEIPFTMHLELTGKLITKLKYYVPNMFYENDPGFWYEDENHYLLSELEPWERTIEVKGTWKGTGCFGGHILFEDA